MSDVPRFCSYCANELRPNARFCNRCGKPTPLQPAAAAPPPPPPAQPQFTPAPPAVQPLPAQPRPIQQPSPVPGPVPAGDSQDKRRQLLIAGGIVLVMGMLLVCALVVGGYWFYLRPTGTPTTTVTGTPPTSTPTGTITPATPTPTGTITPATPTNTGTITPATPTGSLTPAASPEATQSPVPTTAPAAQVNFSGVSFSYNPILAAGVSTEKLAASSPETASFDRLPEHVSLTLRGYPFLPDENPLPQVKVIPLEALESLNPDAAFEIDELRDLLSRKPPEIVDPDETIPYIPLSSVDQVFQACVGYLSFKNGNGVRYVTQYNQDAYPIHNNGIFYTFQGLSQDGRYYISASFPISNGILPDPNSVVVNDEFRSKYDSYIRNREVEMSSQPVTSFTPDLSMLDALIQSLQVQ